MALEGGTVRLGGNVAASATIDARGAQNITVDNVLGGFPIVVDNRQQVAPMLRRTVALAGGSAAGQPVRLTLARPAAGWTLNPPARDVPYLLDDATPALVPEPIYPALYPVSVGPLTIDYNPVRLQQITAGAVAAAPEGVWSHATVYAVTPGGYSLSVSFDGSNSGLPVFYRGGSGADRVTLDLLGANVVLLQSVQVGTSAARFWLTLYGTNAAAVVNVG